MLTFTANLVIRELDNFENGCDPETSTTNFFGEELEPLKIEAENMKELLVKIQKFFNVDVNSILLDSCEELGRLDLQTYTKGNKGLRCSYNKYSGGFKAGNFDMYLNNIVGTVTQYQPLNLTELLKSENNLK